MPKAWGCLSYPDIHGPFPQSGLEDLRALHPSLQPPHRFACPQCWAKGELGFLKPAIETDAARFAA